MIHFISDLHLSPQSPGATALFLKYLAGPARQAESIFILGDFFEAWVGDDDIGDPFNARLVAALRDASDAGLRLFFLHGNRDFLLGPDFVDACGAQLLPAPYVLSLPSWQFVRSHGDALCTDDVEYQSFRRQVRDPQWQAAFLAKPLPERQAIAAQMRAGSEANKQGKAAYLMDINPRETDDFLRAHGYATFIHGHTHRPATHQHMVDGIHVERWVLADWHEDRGEALVWDDERLFRKILT